MGRGLTEDPLFFGAALAAGATLAELAREPPSAARTGWRRLNGRLHREWESELEQSAKLQCGERRTVLTLDFLAYLELERGLSRNTLEAYRSDLLRFGEFLDRRGLSVMEARHGDLAAFLSELAAGAGERPPVAAATLAAQGRVSALVLPSPAP